jgi:hypothetical protein
MLSLTRERGSWWRADWSDTQAVHVRFRDVHGRWKIAEIRITAESGISSQIVRGVPLSRIENFANAPGSYERIRSAAVGDRLIGTGDSGTGNDQAAIETVANADAAGSRYDDVFYRMVADAVVAAGRGAAPRISRARGVPLTTVHRWVREARRRGFLAPTGRERRKEAT